MGAIRPIRSEADYQAALARIDALMAAEAGTPEGEELEVLVDLVDHYESRHGEMGYPSASAAIEFRMEQAGLTRRDLVPFIGSPAKVSQVLAGKRALTMPMAQALHEHLGIPAEVLLKSQRPSLSDPLAGIEWHRFPLKAMASRGWIPDVPNLSERAKDLVGELIHRAGGPRVAVNPLFRKNDHARVNAKTDAYALRGWCWRVLAEANENRPPVAYRAGAVTPDFLRELARLSGSPEGPRQARDLLAARGVPLVIVPHLPKTHLDGAALELGDGTPVVALTLRFDRIDNFWFCLLHELAHVGRHLGPEGDFAFVDDLRLREVGRDRDDPKEREADEWAEEALIPREAWARSAVRASPSPTAVLAFARALDIHPAIVAGRIRHERKNYRMLSHFVGTGEIRRQFGLEPAAAGE